MHLRARSPAGPQGPGSLPRFPTGGGVADAGVMRIELLVIPDCPHAEHATRALETALTELGVGELQFRIVVVSTDEQAQAFGFPGSPTFRVDGRDVFDGNRTPALSCRLYPGQGGGSIRATSPTRCAGNSPQAAAPSVGSRPKRSTTITGSPRFCRR